MNGIIKTWFDKKGYGFITAADGGPDVFCHCTDVAGAVEPPVEGERVVFEIETTPKGRRARAVQFESV